MPPRIRPSTSLTRSKPSPSTLCSSCLLRAFSSTPATKKTTLARTACFAFLNGPGSVLREPVPGKTNYLSAYDMRTGRRLDAPKAQSKQAQERGEPSRTESPDSQALEAAAYDDSPKNKPENDRSLRPFPLNPQFVSQSILSEPLRQEVWKRVQVDKKSVRQVSVELGITMQRVGAVVRLVEVENRMKSEGETLALPYAKAIHAMVPTTRYSPTRITPHEPINDLPHHPLTAPQLFYPTSESRAFNRTDAGRVFSAAPRLPDSQDIGQGGTPPFQPWEDSEKEIIGKPTPQQGQRGFRKKGNKFSLQTEREVLKPADARIPHPHLIAYETDKRSPELQHNASELLSRYNQRLEDEEKKVNEGIARRTAREEATKTRIQSERWEWVVQDVVSERFGRAEPNIGNRYGVPSQERKRGKGEDSDEG